MKFLLVGKHGEIEEVEAELKRCVAVGLIHCVMWPEEEKLFMQELRSIEQKFLITVNLAGFELTTLRKGIFYNILNCKSLHLLTERHLKNEYLLAKQLSISMFFYCQGEHYYNFLKKTYPDIPYLGLMKPMGADKKNEYKVSYILEIFSRLKKETGLPLLP